MEFVRKSVPWLFGKRKLEVEEVEFSRRKKQKLEGPVDGFIMASAKKGYSSVVSWLFPQLANKPPEVIHIEDDDTDEIQVVKVVTRKEQQSKGKTIRYDQLSSFQGFSKSSTESDKGSANHQSKKKNLKLYPSREANRSSHTKQKMNTVHKKRKPDFLKSRELFRRMLGVRSNSRNLFEEIMSEFYKGKFRSNGDAADCPEVINLEANSDDEEVQVVEQSDSEVLDDMSKLKAEIYLVDLEDSIDKDTITISDESDFESDEDEKYYENRVFEKKECDIVYDANEDYSDEDEKFYENRVFEKKECNITYDSDEDQDRVTKRKQDNEHKSDMTEVLTEEIDKNQSVGTIDYLSFKPAPKPMPQNAFRGPTNNIEKPKYGVLVDAHGIEIRNQDLVTLKGLNWLNDNIINFYMSMVVARAGPDNSLPSVYAFSTFFYPKLETGGHSAVARWTKKVDLFSYDLVLVPVHLGIHWCLASIDLKKMAINYYDR